MLGFYYGLAIRLRALRWLIVIITLVAATCFISLLLFAKPDVAQQWQLSCIVITIMGLLAYLISILFSQPIVQVEPQHRFFTRIKIRLQQTCSYLLALLLSLIVLAVLFLGLRALRGIIGSLFF